MMKKFLLILFFSLFLTSCRMSDAKRIKEDYESLNGQISASGNEYLTVGV